MMFQLMLRMPEYYEILVRYEGLLAGIGSSQLSGTFHASMAICEVVLGFYDSAVQNSKRGADLCQLGGDLHGVARALYHLQWSHFYKGELEQSIALKDRILRELPEGIALYLTVAPLSLSSLAKAQLGRWNDAVKDARQALALAEEYSDDTLISLAASYVGLANTWKGHFDPAVEYGELAVKKALSPQDKAFSKAFLAWTLCRVERSEEHVQNLAQFVQDLTSRRIAGFAITFMPLLAEGFLLAGYCDKARQMAADAVDLAESRGAKWFLAFSHRLIGEIALKTNPDEAPPHFDRAMSICKGIKAENELALAYSGMGRYHKQQGNTEQAKEYLAKALEIFERLGTLIEPDKVREELEGLTDT